MKMIVIVPSKVCNVFEDSSFGWYSFTVCVFLRIEPMHFLSQGQVSWTVAILPPVPASIGSYVSLFVRVFLHSCVHTHSWSHVTKSWCKGENNDRKTFWEKIFSRWKNIEIDPIVEKSVAQGRKKLGFLQWGLREFLNIRTCRTNRGSLTIGLSFSSSAWKTQGCWDFNNFSYRLKCQNLTVDKGGRFRGDMRLWETRTLVVGTGKQRQVKKDDSRSFNSVVDNPVIIKDGSFSLGMKATEMWTL